jgi:hypothetical protein
MLISVNTIVVEKPMKNSSIDIPNFVIFHSFKPIKL